jgi:hypothetical protein
VLSPGLSIKPTSNYRETFKWLLEGTLRKNAPIKRADNLKTEPGPFLSETSYAVGHPRFKTYKKEKDSFAPKRIYNASKGLLAKCTCVYTQHPIASTTALKYPIYVPLNMLSDGISLVILSTITLTWPYRIAMSRVRLWFAFCLGYQWEKCA